MVGTMMLVPKGHWAADAGAGYTYLNENAGIEFSAGLQFNFTNPDTQYRSGTEREPLQ
jgi:hypothetical protein